MHELLGRRWLGVPDSRAIWQPGFLSEVDPTVVRFPGTGGRRRILGNREQFRAYKVPTPRKFEYYGYENRIRFAGALHYKKVYVPYPLRPYDYVD